MTPRRSLSRSVEDYLKAIYGLTQGGLPASTSRIADALDVQPASVSGMIKRLARDGLLEHERYRGVRLTAKGAVEALRIVRRHRILETYLVERLGYSWDDVHAEAERLEHAASDDLIEHMAEALGNPSHDPHGAPIPTAGGEIERIDHSVLEDAPRSVSLRVRAVNDDDSARLRRLEEIGLVPGARLVITGAKAGDVLTAYIEDREGPTDLSPELARQVFVTAEDPAPGR